MRMVNSVLGQLRFTKVLCYLDDVLIPTKTIDESLEILREVLTIFKRNRLTLKLSKCFFLRTNIEYLGYIISEFEIRPNEIKTEAVRNFPVPQDVHQVRQYMGLINYFRKFIPKCAQRSRPLTMLLGKDIPWSWGPEQSKAFEDLKMCLTSEPVLTLFNPDLEIKLYTDASRLGLAEILVQISECRENVIAYFSKHTTIDQQKYHSFELEALAIVVCVRKFRQYLLGRSFTIVTDCVAVKNAFSKSEVNARIGRWVLELSEYQFEIVHRQGNQMQHVDALSRNLPSLKYGVHVTNISEEDWLLAAQQSDKSIIEIKRILESGDRASNVSLFNDYALKGGKVYKITGRGLRWVVPKAARFQILRMAHDESGHFGFDKTFDLVSSQYWFKKMRRFVRKYVQNCLNCLYFKLPGGKQQGSLHPIPKNPVPFHTIHVDHLGPFIKTRTGNTQLFIIIDAFTKFIIIYPVKSTKSQYVIRCLQDMIKYFGVPHRIKADRGKAFTSDDFKNYCNEIGTKLHLNAVAMPRGNGQVERYYQTILNSLSVMRADLNDDQWDDNVTNI